MERIRQFLFTNKTNSQTVAKNTIWLFAGEIPSRILKLVVVLFATRTLGVAGWGTFSYALSFISLFYVFGDIGINTFITREIAKKGENQYQFLSASLFIKLSLLVLACLASILLAPRISNVGLDIRLVIILALLIFSDSLREFVLSVNRALEKMEREAFIKIIMNVIITSLGIVLLIHKAEPLSLAIAYVIGSITASLVAIRTLILQLKFLTWKFSFGTVKIILNFAWPFIALTLFSAAITNIDIIMLGQIKSTVEVGLYSASQRLVQFMTILPIFLALSMFPTLSKNETDHAVSKNIFEKTMVMILAIGLPITLIGFIFRQDIINLIFGIDYKNAAPIFGIFIFSIFAFFPNIIINNVIFAKNLQKKFLVASLIGLIINICLNLYLIPRSGAIGAAISAVCSQLLIVIINWQMLKRVFAFNIISKLKIIILANIGILIVIWLSKFLGLPFIISIIIALISYGYILYILKEPTISSVRNIFR